MRFSEVVGRLNGFSTPIFGVSWQPPTSDVAVARGVVSFLEEKRVLYNPFEVEIPDACVGSVNEIRARMTEILAAGGLADELQAPIRAIRAASRRFVDAVGNGERPSMYRVELGRPAFHDFVFNQALGELRSTVGLHVAFLSVRYGIDVEDQLATILPEADSPI